MNLLELAPLNGTVLNNSCDGTIDIQTPAAPWTYALLVPLHDVGQQDPAAIGLHVSLDLEVISGTIGVFLTDQVAQAPIGQERIIDAGGRIRVEIDADRTVACFLCVRTAEAGSSHVRFHGLEASVRRSFDITDVIDEVMPALLRSPGTRALQAVAHALSLRFGHSVALHEIGALTCRRVPLPVAFERMLDDPLGRLILDDAKQLIALLPTYDPSKMDRRSGFLGRDYFEAYFRQSTIRVYHLVQQLRSLGFTSGSVLEIGSLCGQFAVALRHLGFEVTVVDRYRAYQGAFVGYSGFFHDLGIQVVETDRLDEAARISALGQFDAVMAMAVIEHIPHTPREFVRMLTSHIRPGGVLALDTPNIARDRNRKQLAKGQSIHQALEDQYYASIPWEGHHREYTASEMAWMLEQAGCSEVRTTLFDYNLLQFKELSSEHIETLLAMAIDPTLADMVLAVGRFGGRAWDEDRRS